MTRKIVLVLSLALAGVTACDSSPSAPDGPRPQFDGRTRTRTTTTTTTTASSDSTQTNVGGGQIGDPCDPETYNGPYRCIPDPGVVGGYVIAY